MKIITNNHPRPLACLAELPGKVRTDFDYVGDEFDARFVQYKGVWYDVYDTQAIRTVPGAPMGWAMVVAEDSPLASWDSVVSETFFSGVLFRFADEDQVIVGSYFA
jgi:hypothetical protein